MINKYGNFLANLLDKLSGYCNINNLVIVVHQKIAQTCHFGLKRLKLELQGLETQAFKFIHNVH